MFVCVERCEGVEERRGGVVEVVGVDRTFVYIERRVREKINNQHKQAHKKRKDIRELAGKIIESEKMNRSFESVMKVVLDGPLAKASKWQTKVSLSLVKSSDQHTYEIQHTHKGRRDEIDDDLVRERSQVERGENGTFEC